MTSPETKHTYWLSFCDADKPKGEQFLGVVLVDVTATEAALAWLVMPHMHDQEEGPWIAAAMANCKSAGVNPGGQVASVCVDEMPGLAVWPRLRLLSKTEIAALEAEGENASHESPQLGRQGSPGHGIPH